jgi:hypothetical protein
MTFAGSRKLKKSSAPHFPFPTVPFHQTGPISSTLENMAQCYQCLKLERLSPPSSPIRLLNFQIEKSTWAAPFLGQETSLPGPFLPQGGDSRSPVLGSNSAAGDLHQLLLVVWPWQVI